MMATMFQKVSIVLFATVTATACNDAEFSSKNTMQRRVGIADGNPDIIQEFSTGGFAGTGMFSFAASNTLLSKELKLENAYSERSRDFTQIDRAMVTRDHKQGAAGTPTAETFQQGNYGIVDILVVIDDSGSMSQEQDKLAPNLAPLLEEVKNADWKINVITTSISAPCSRAIIQKGQADAATSFATAVKAGIGGDATERGVERAVQGLACNTPTSTWLRPNSSLAVLFVTDEDNCSNGLGCPGTLGADPNYVRNYINSQAGRVVGTNARFYGIYWVPGTACTGGGSPANQYHALVTGSNGAFGSICDASYLTTLQAISRNIASTLKTQFTLKDRPDPNSLVVRVNGVQKTSGFSIADRTLTFTDIPPPNARIDVTYVTGRGAQLKEFALGEKPAAGTLQVLVNMAAVTAGFTVAANPDRVIFNTEPAPSADIRFMFRRDTALLRDFSLAGNNPVDGTMKVFVDGQEIKDYTYDAVARMIRLANAPLDLAKVRASFRNLDGPVLSYPFAPTTMNPQDVRAIDKDTKAPVRVEYKDGDLVVHADEHKEGRMIVVSYETIDSYKTEIRLARQPVPGSVVLDVAPATCNLESGIVLNGDILEVNCDIADVADFAGSYKYDLDVLSSFTLQGVRDPDKGTWTVTVDGEPRSDYERQGSTIKFNPATLPRRGTVVVKFSAGEDP